MKGIRHKLDTITVGIKASMLVETLNTFGKSIAHLKKGEFGETSDVEMLSQEKKVETAD